MTIMIMVGSFPREVFIERKVRALAALKGVQIFLVARDFAGAASLTRSMPRNVRMVRLLADNRARLVRQIHKDLVKALFFMAVHPLRAWTLFHFLRRGYPGRNPVWREWFHVLPLVNCKPDIIHAEFFSIGTRYIYLRGFFNVPFFVSNRGTEINTLSVHRGSRAKEIAKHIDQFDAIHCVSDAIKTELLKLFPSVEKRCFVNRPAVDYRDFTEREDRFANEKLKMLSVGRLEWIKGYDYLLQSFRILKESGVSFEAEIVGDGDLFHELGFSIEDLELVSEVKLVGALSASAVMEKLKEADLFILPSHQEGISNSLLEAMAAGLPVITTDTGGLAEVVKHNYNGLLVPIRRPDKIAEAALQIRSDSTLRKSLGLNARNTVRAEFSLEHQARTFYEHYAIKIKESRCTAA